jgi:hypothetical protein
MKKHRERRVKKGSVEMVNWEYRVVPVKTRIHSKQLEGNYKPVIEDIQDDLNSLGEKGWELVSVQNASLPNGRMFTVAYLKRQKETE